MKLTSRKTVSISEKRRNNLQFERQRAVAVRELYPWIEQLQVSLVFDDGGRHAFSPQSHTFYPAACAFFRFACPCADCDGDFDLREPMGALLAGMSQGERTSVPRGARGRLCCEGVRLRDRIGSRPCAMTLEYQLAAAWSPRDAQAGARRPPDSRRAAP